MAEKKPKKKKEFSLKNHIEKSLRASFRKAPVYNEAKRRAKEEYFETSKHGKPLRRVHYKCAQCGKFFLDKTGFKEIAVDHISPVIDTATGWVDYNTYIDRLFCSVDNLQILCNYAGERDGVRSCHKLKTAKEKTELSDTIRVKKKGSN